MPLFGPKPDPPPPDFGPLDYVLWLARDYCGVKSAGPDSAIAQDLGLYGEDVDDFAARIAERYGDDVFSWPWDRFTGLGESVSPLWLPAMLWQLATWPFRGRFGHERGAERLTLRHIAFVLERGEWVEP